MASSKVQIYNLALLRAGSSKRVNDVDEGSNEANICNEFYDQSLAFVLEDRPWRFAKKRAYLAPKTGTPPSVWQFQYAWPSDCLKLRTIVTPGARTQLHDEKIPFEKAFDDGPVIYTDLEDAEAIYTVLVETTEWFPPSFVSALAYHLASEIALPLRGERSAGLISMLQSAYAQVCNIASASDLNQGFDHPPTNEFERSRNA